MRRRHTQSLILSTLALALLIASANLHADKVYKWVDDEGVVHYGTRAPSDRETSSFTPHTGHSEPVTYDYGQDEEEKERRSAQNKGEEEERVTLPDPERCEAARNNLRALNNFGRVRVKNADGEVHYLTEEEQQERIKEAQQVIDEAC